MVKLKELVKALEVENFSGNFEIEITDIAYDSREVKPKNLFVAISGFKADGHDFIDEAIENGAGAVLVEEQVDIKEVPVIEVNDTRKALAQVSARFYNYPAQNLTMVGVTGTNGKTTTTYLIETILAKLGLETGLIGTIKNKIGAEESEASRTTPESLDLQRYLAQMRDKGITHVVMEVSSHALELDRVLEIDFDRKVFTNLSRDHIDFHGSWDDYFAAKLKLFQANDNPAIINLDDKRGQAIAKKNKGEAITYGLEKGADFRAEDIEIDLKGVNYKLRTRGDSLDISLNLTGRFNVYNSLAAIAAVASMGYSLLDIKKSLKEASRVPGRFQSVEAGQDFGVIVDYAHTPDGMENVLQTAQDLACGRVIVVFGCGGDRDRDKRPMMGKLGIKLAELAVITSDNPRSEKPAAIIEEILAGVRELEASKGEDYLVVENRREAIKKAISLANKEDIVLIIGKGHETYQDFGDRVIDFDDKKVAKEILQERSGN